jgi:hypothetical protein
MRKTLAVSAFLLLGYVVCSAACGGTSSTTIPDGGGGAAGKGGAAGTEGSGGTTGTGGSGGSGGSMGSGGSGGTAGSDGGSKDSGKDAPEDSSDSGGVCPGVGDAGLGLSSACNSCIASMCCSQFMACEGDPKCVAVETCTYDCYEKTHKLETCAEKCIAATDGGTGGKEAQTLDECLAFMCATPCGS